MLLTFLFRVLQLYCCTAENGGKTKQECTNMAGYGSLAAAMLRFSSGYSSCIAVPQKCYVSFHGTQVVLLYHRKCYVSFHSIQVVL